MVLRGVDAVLTSREDDLPSPACRGTTPLARIQDARLSPPAMTGLPRSGLPPLARRGFFRGLPGDGRIAVDVVSLRHARPGIWAKDVTRASRKGHAR